MSLKCRCVGCTNSGGQRGHSFCIPACSSPVQQGLSWKFSVVKYHLLPKTSQRGQLSACTDITGDLAVHLGTEGKMCCLLFPNQILEALGPLVASNCRGNTAMEEEVPGIPLYFIT